MKRGIKVTTNETNVEQITADNNDLLSTETDINNQIHIENDEAMENIATVSNPVENVEAMENIVTVSNPIENDEAIENIVTVSNQVGDDSFSSNDSFIERENGEGRRLLPNRSGTEEDLISTPPSRPLRQVSTPSPRLSPVDMSRSSSSTSILRARQGGSSHRTGRGKGGKRLGIRGGLINKDRLGPRSKTITEAKKLRRQDWQEWVKTYKKQTEEYIKKARKSEIKCSECEEIILKKSYLKHRTERGCHNLDPKLKMSNWTLENYYE